MTQPSSDREKHAIALLKDLVEVGCWELDQEPGSYGFPGTPVCFWCGTRQEDEAAEPKHADDCAFVAAERFLQQST